MTEKTILLLILAVSITLFLVSVGYLASAVQDGVHEIESKGLKTIIENIWYGCGDKCGGTE